MSKTIRFLSPDWREESKSYQYISMDMDELLDILLLAQQMASPFDCEIMVSGRSLSARLCIESLMDALDIKDDTSDLSACLVRIMEKTNG